MYSNKTAFSLLLLSSLLAGCTTTGGAKSQSKEYEVREQGKVIIVYDERGDHVITLYPRPFEGEWVGTDKEGKNLYIRTVPW